MKKFDGDTLAGHLSLITKSTYSCNQHFNGLFVHEIRPTKYDSVGGITVENGVECLQSNIEAMKEHIEMAEIFLHDINNGESTK